MKGCSFLLWSCMSYSIYVTVLQWLSLYCMQLQGMGQQGCDRRAGKAPWWYAGVLVHVVLEQFQREGKDVSWTRQVLDVNHPQGSGRTEDNVSEWHCSGGQKT